MKTTMHISKHEFDKGLAQERASLMQSLVMVRKSREEAWVKFYEQLPGVDIELIRRRLHEWETLDTRAKKLEHRLGLGSQDEQAKMQLLGHVVNAPVEDSALMQEEFQKDKPFRTGVLGVDPRSKLIDGRMLQPETTTLEDQAP